MVHSYNNTFHRTIGQAPSSVKNEDVSKLRERMYGVEDDINAHPKLKVGDKVRISKTRRTSDKGYLPNWTEEIFSVSEAIATAPPTYKLIDYGGKEVRGSFYDKELQRVDKKDDVYKVEKILRTRRKIVVLHRGEICATNHKLFCNTWLFSQWKTMYSMFTNQLCTQHRSSTSWYNMLQLILKSLRSIW